MATFIDTHAHLDEERFDGDRQEVVDRAAEAGVARILSIGTTAATSRKNVELAARFPNVFAVVGIQPNYAAEVEPGDREAIEELATAEKVVAIGETGLDRYWDFAPLPLQKEYFEWHVRLAQRLNLPFVVHCRDAEDDVVAQLTQLAEAQPLKGVMHSFAGGLQTARACLDLGLHISFAGMLTFKKSDALRAVAAEIPRDRLLVETDSPYLAPTPKRGKRNEPAFVQFTNACLAECHGIEAEAMAAQTTRNARELFGLK